MWWFIVFCIVRVSGWVAILNAYEDSLRDDGKEGDANLDIYITHHQRWG